MLFVCVLGQINYIKLRSVGRVLGINMQGKQVVVMGVANKRSIAWGIACSLHKAGAKLIFTYGNERLKSGVEELVHSLDNGQSYPVLFCDVASDDSIDVCFKTIKEQYGAIDSLIHAIAFANREELVGEYLNTTRAGFLLAHNISAYSLTAVVKAARANFTNNGSIVTLTYLGGERAIANYNVMGVAKASLEASVKYLATDLGKDGIRINAISAGPIRTLSAKGVADFNSSLQQTIDKAPLHRLNTLEELGNTAAFLCSDLASGITGENIHVDSGYHVLGP